MAAIQSSMCKNTETPLCRNILCSRSLFPSTTIFQCLWLSVSPWTPLVSLCSSWKCSWRLPFSIWKLGLKVVFVSQGASVLKTMSASFCFFITLKSANLKQVEKLMEYSCIQKYYLKSWSCKYFLSFTNLKSLTSFTSDNL